MKIEGLKIVLPAVNAKQEARLRERLGRMKQVATVIEDGKVNFEEALLEDRTDPVKTVVICREPDSDRRLGLVFQ